MAPGQDVICLLTRLLIFAGYPQEYSPPQSYKAMHPIKHPHSPKSSCGSRTLPKVSHYFRNRVFKVMLKAYLGLVAKPFAPRVPLAVLTLAGALPDVVFFLLQLVGIETFNFDQSIVRKGGCFPYTNDYPFSHSLMGMVVFGMYHYW